METDPTQPTAPQTWSLTFAIDGDLRFLSHHDVLRAVERIATRARLPLRYSEGFNPRPRISLAHPRPVGVATRGDLLVLTLEERVSTDEMLETLNRHAPRGMRFLAAGPLRGRKAPRVVRVGYELALGVEQAAEARRLLESLQSQDAWPVERQVQAPSSGKRKQWRPRRIDLRPLVDAIEIRDRTLRWALVRRGDLWARPGEVLRVLGVEEALSATVRTDIQTEAE